MKNLLASLLFAGLCLPTVAADHTIQMLNYGDEGGMVFEPAFLKVEVGDTITFEPTQSGHYVQSFVLPEGVDPWKSAIDEPFTVTVSEEGVYFYFCPPHLMMSMIGLIQVGEAVNMDAITEQSERMRPRLVMNKDRLDLYLGQIEQ